MDNIMKKCDYKIIDDGSMGIPDYVYKTTCGKFYDVKKVNEFDLNYCINCGQLINK